MKNYLVGIDIGTGGVRVAVFDLNGHLAAFSTVPLQSYIPGPGMTEQNPKDWWSALGEASKQALRKANVTPEEIAGIATGQFQLRQVSVRVKKRSLPGVGEAVIEMTRP